MKRILSIILSLIITATLLAVPASAQDTLLIATNPNKKITFIDVDKTTIAGQAIYKLVDAGILEGDGDGKFRPDDSISRAELAKVVNKIFGFTEIAEEGFKDLNGSEWYYNYVLAAKKAGYIVGYDDGTFRGEANVTREESCAILCRVASIYDIGLKIEVTDQVSEWAVPYVQKVLANGLMSLEAGNTFRATQNITRAEFSTTFANFVQISENNENKPQGGGSTGGGSTGGGSTGGDSTGGGSTGGGSTGSGSTSGGSTSGGSTSGGSTSGGSTSGGSTSGGSTGGGSTGGDATGGDSTGGGSTGSGSTEPEVNIEEANKEMLENLKKVSADIEKNKYEFPTLYPRKLINIIKECVDKTIKDGETELIDAAFVKTKYADEINEAKGYYDIIMADNELKAEFQEALVCLNTETITWLAEEFGLI